MQYYSQDSQDFNLDKYIFKGFKDGFFVDVGAHDGKTFNNTLFFEENYGWTGLNIEPLPEIYDKLCQNRNKCINLNCAIDENEGNSIFCNNDMLSGLEKYYDPRHINRINHESKSKTYNDDSFTVKTRRLDNIFREYNINNINYLSVDVEGAELSVLKSINYNEVFIDVIGFENNYPDISKNVIEFLKNKNYFIVLSRLDIFMIHSDSKFINNF